MCPHPEVAADAIDQSNPPRPKVFAEELEPAEPEDGQMGSVTQTSDGGSEEEDNEDEDEEAQAEGGYWEPQSR
jgi:hypothetical protein